MTITEKFLGQALAGTAGNTVYTLPGTVNQALIRTITVSNVSTAQALASIYIDNGDGTAMSTSQAIAYEHPIEVGGVAQFDGFYLIDNPGSATLSVKASVGTALNFTAFGAEYTD